LIGTFGRDPRAGKGWRPSTVAGSHGGRSALPDGEEETMTVTASTSTWTRDEAGWLCLERVGSWHGELVELMVLAEHGDVPAGRRLRVWLSADAAARATFARISHDVEVIRSPVWAGPEVPDTRVPV
jgi:hypothetical protein